MSQSLCFTVCVVTKPSGRQTEATFRNATEATSDLTVAQSLFYCLILTSCERLNEIVGWTCDGSKFCLIDKCG